MENKIKIFVACDDKKNFNDISNHLQDKFNNIDIFKFDTLKSISLSILNDKPQIIICDINLPDGSSIDLLKKVRSEGKNKNLYFVIIDNSNDSKYKSISYTYGVDDHFFIPIDWEQFLSKISSFIRHISYQLEISNENALLIQLAEELEQEIQDMIKLSIKFLQARIPSSYEMLKRVAASSVWIAQTYGNLSNEEIRDVEITAFLSYAGRIFLPDNLLKSPVMITGKTTDPIMNQVPISGSEIVSSVRRFKNVALYVRHIYENFDGSGIPDRLQSWQIPFASRIVRAVLDYEEYRTIQKKSATNAIGMIMRESQRLYDNRVAILLEQYVTSYEQELKIKDEIALNLLELKPGMITTRAIYTEKGLKLVPQGVNLTESTISKIINIASSDSILGYVYVKH
ncbi:MAG TPA: HD domain-containing phosphohydrolase [Candidatus Kapabacteria bacterium]|nr:HD domain-containing phosphohydrolase [Candidatus Kapabacteria bacterium]